MAYELSQSQPLPEWHRPPPRFVGLDIVDWLSGCKYGFIPYLQNNWTLQVLTIVTF